MRLCGLAQHGLRHWEKEKWLRIDVFEDTDTDRLQNPPTRSKDSMHAEPDRHHL